MRAFPLLLACSVVASGAVGASAQSNVSIAATTPAEVPANDFNGRQYVDSAGCVFVRAGQGDVAAWMPRLTRSNEPLCGYTPTIIEPTNGFISAVAFAENSSAADRPLVSVGEAALMSAPRSGARSTSSARGISPQDGGIRPATRAACRATALRLGHGIGCDEGAENGVGGHLMAIQIPPQTRNSTHGADGLNGKDLRRSRVPVTIVVASDATYSF